jgi:hypothetical protein
MPQAKENGRLFDSPKIYHLPVWFSPSGSLYSLCNTGPKPLTQPAFDNLVWEYQVLGLASMAGIIPKRLKEVRSWVREDHIHLHHLLEIGALFSSKWRGRDSRLKKLHRKKKHITFLVPSKSYISLKPHTETPIQEVSSQEQKICTCLHFPLSRHYHTCTISFITSATSPPRHYLFIIAATQQ